ncbi:MAG: aldo/keto reductase [bacterium]
MNKVKLYNGVEVPQVGLGVFLSENGDEAANAVKVALQNGYRHIDTAMSYGNETSVAKGIELSGVKREDIFITTKMATKDLRSSNFEEGFNNSLKNLNTDYIDLYLLHWPTGEYVEAYKFVEKMYKAGKIKAIGVSNFQIHHLKELEGLTKPMMNQIEQNPQFNNFEVIKYCHENDIQVTGWSPLGGGRGKSLLNNETILELASKYNKTAAQVILRWQVQLGIVTLPKSVTESRIISNIDVFNFELSNEDMEVMNNLNTGVRVGTDPDNITW